MSGSPEPSRVRTLKGALPLLRRPPALQAVRFMPVIDAGSHCRLAADTDVRFVIDQLNAVCGSRLGKIATMLEDAEPDILAFGPRGRSSASTRSAGAPASSASSPTIRAWSAWPGCLHRAER